MSSVETKTAPVSEAPSELTPNAHDAWKCPSCAATADGKFCSQCGEQRPGHHDLSLRHLLTHSFETLFHFDAKIFGSLRTLLGRPGQLSCDFVSGRRKPYLHPFQLFFVVNLLFFVLQPLIGWNTLTTNLDVHLHRMFYSAMARRLVSARIDDGHIAPAEFEQEFDHRAHLHAKSLVILMVPIFALLLAVLNWRKRRFFVEHLVFALHFYSFWLIWLVFSLGTISLVVRGLVHAGMHINDIALDQTVTLLGGIVIATYLAVALHRFYRNGWVISAIEGVALTIATLYILQAYRFVLFFTTLYS